MDLIYDLLSQVVKKTNVTINITSNPYMTEEPTKTETKTETETETKTETETETAPSGSEPVGESPRKSGLASADVAQLINDLENMSATLKKINMSMVDREFTEVFLMLQNFDRILYSAKILSKLWY
jgi:hypothetical protein